MDRRLSDTERKVFRILVNSSHLDEWPSVTQMSRWSCRSKKDILTALKGLKEKKYIQWEKENRMKLLRRKEFTEVDLLFQGDELWM